MSVTIYDIAEEAGVSASTVSRVLNSSSLISDERSNKIIEIANRLGYTKRSIKKQKSRAILNIKLVLGQLSDPSLPLFYSVPELIDGIKAGVPENQLNIICETSTKTKDLFSSKKSGQADAVIFAFCQIPKATEIYLKENNIPFLVLNRSPIENDFITFNNQEAMKELVKKSVSRLSKPVFLEMYGENEITLERRKGFIKACEETSINHYECIELTDLEQINESFLRRLKEKQQSDIIAMNDILASVFMFQALKYSYKVPGDFSISGFDGSSVSSVLPGELRTVSLQINRLGRKAGDWITKRVLERDEEVYQVFIKGRFIEGNTF
ncbi:LacI family DNA-binding transcriptional regulator [Lentisphaera marina]|uniref:LacI family DNA-binding transcriptional regulator n=1 Tax=Lentisphaera marina TaxID=1111041 RepID=UPI00236596C6|nr:LacI family DNA-binding transcriptional regulator [Lentisphaera marina]MDD7985352.1 LacI family DNA-binding transcriptional regulator [Lentisphaera marina]